MNALTFLTIVTLLLVTSSEAYEDQNLRLASSSTPGGAMVGSILTVNYEDGSTEQAEWRRLDPLTGTAVGAFFSLFFQGTSTFPDRNPLAPPSSRSPWIFEAKKSVVSWSFDLSTGSAVWDILTYSRTNLTYTSNSGDGFPFGVTNATDLNVPSANYSGVPTFPGRDVDVWYVLTVKWSLPFLGTMVFIADTDSLEDSLEICEVIPTIGPLQAIYVPELRPNTVPSSIYTNDNTTYLHLEFWSYAATNRRTGINEENDTWIFFGTAYGQTFPGCTANVDYFWQFSRTADEYGQCLDIYTLDFDLEQFLANCPVNYQSANNSECGQRAEGAITVRTVTDRVTYRNRLPIRDVGAEWSQHGFVIDFGGCGDSTFDVRVYAAVEISAVIDDYFIPPGTTEKTFDIYTAIQNPENEGFSLVYSGGIHQITDSDYISVPDIENTDLLIVSFSEMTSSCIEDEQLDDDGIMVRLCGQRWTLSITPKPGSNICYLTNVFYRIPFEIVCNGEDPLLCPITDMNKNASIVVQIDTSNFCAVTIETYSITGQLQTYKPDFSSRGNAFFSNDTVGFQLVLSGINPATIESVSITYLAGVLSPTSLSDLYQPGIRTFIENGGSAAVLIGAVPPLVNRSADVGFTYACPAYPRPVPYPSGCPPNVLRFTLYLNPSIWPIRPEDFRNLRFAITTSVKTRSSSGKRNIEDWSFVSDEFSQSSAGLALLGGSRR